MGKPVQDLRGVRFGRLIVVEYHGRGRWRCSCDCGGEAYCLTNNLNKGNSSSCGCVNHEAHFKHGMSGTPIYKVWQAMRDRCENPRNRDYHNYGGRGISVAPRWREFSNFLADMGARPKGFDIDREDNNGPYSPENCRWITRQKNLNNRRDNNRIEWRGETRTVSEWAKIINMHEETLRRRINSGWGTERAFTQKVQSSNPQPYSFRPRPERKRKPPITET